MILDFGSYIINEASLKKLKREVHGVLNMSARKRMRKELRNNIITFKFKKRNGEIRTAHGTLHPDYLPPLKGGAPRPEHQMVYYDLDKEGWRSFRSFKFIKILNVKPVDGTSKPKPSTKPVSKPVHKSEDEDEEIKKTTPTKEVEKEEEKKVHTEEKKEKKKVHEIDDEIEDDDDKKSVLDDKDTPEEEEVIKKDKEKEKEEKEEKKEKEEKDEDEDKEKDEKKKTNESVTPVEEYPNVTTLGDGEYDGALWGHCFVYEGQKYYSEIGWMNIFPSYCKMVVEGDKVMPHQVDEYQRESLKKLYQ